MYMYMYLIHIDPYAYEGTCMYMYMYVDSKNCSLYAVNTAFLWEQLHYKAQC